MPTLACGLLAGGVIITQIPPFRDLAVEGALKIGRALSQTWDGIAAAGSRVRPRDIPKPDKCIGDAPNTVALACKKAALACCEWMEDEEVDMTNGTRGRCKRVEDTRPPYIYACHTLCGDALAVCAEAATKGME